MCTRLWLLENQIGTKVTDTIDPLDVQYDRNGRPYTYTAAEGYKPTTARVGSKSITRFKGGYVNQWGNDIRIGTKSVGVMTSGLELNQWG